MPPTTQRHNINLSRHVWGELKLRSVQEGISASELVAYVVDRYAGEGGHKGVREHGEGLYQPGGSGESSRRGASSRRDSSSRRDASSRKYQPRGDDDRLGRTVFFPPETWARAQAAAERRGESVAGLIEGWLRHYLGLIPLEEAAEAGGEEEKPSTQPEQGSTKADSVIQLGDECIYLGDNPIRIDWKTGKPKEDS